MTITIATSWETLGPFQIGTREAPWGADPLEYYGGFHALTQDATKTYSSSLASNGKVTWGTVNSTKLNYNEYNVSTLLEVEFEDIDWIALQHVYGWPALQFQAWLRGTIHNECTQRQSISLAIDNVFEFWLDDERHVGGDIFAFRRSPLNLQISPGRHVLDIRVVRDVRTSGAKVRPIVPVHIEVIRHESPLCVLRNSGQIFPDVVVISGDKLRMPSTPASVLVSNTAAFDIEIVDVSSTLPPVEVTCRHAFGIKLLAGQTRPIVFSVNVPEAESVQQDTLLAQITIEYRGFGINPLRSSVSFLHNFRVRPVHAFHKVTFLRAGIVSYCMLRPPQNTTRVDDCASSVMVYLHGAGIEADSDQVVRSLNGTEGLPTWVLIPQGTTSWGGDDWHEWGAGDIVAAVQAIEPWIKLLGLFDYGPRQDSIMVIGHSNGGQGVWYMATHFPDFVKAIAPVSCYNSVQAYVPPQFWRENNPWKRAVVDGVLADYRHELLLPNAKGIPILQQHGAEDENVPVFHSRRLAELIRLTNMSSDYNEISGGHWFDGVMTTESLKKFYSVQTERGQSCKKPVSDFEFVVSNPRCSGSKSGISVIDLFIPGQLSKLDVHFYKAKAVAITTSNIKALSFSELWSDLEEVTLDGCRLTAPKLTEEFPIFLEKSNGALWKRISARVPFHLGGLAAILRTDSALTIVNQDKTTLNISHQIARNLLQYFAMDAEIVHSLTEVSSTASNIISVGIGSKFAPASSNIKHPVSIPVSNRVSIRDFNGTSHSYRATEHGLAAIYLRPYTNNRLELVVWGTDLGSLSVASRLVPTTTGTGPPDFVIMDKSMLWRGVDAALALGFFDSNWATSLNSFIS